MDKSTERELRNDIKEMRAEMNEGFKELSVQLAKVTTKQNMTGWIFKCLITVIVGGLGGIITTHFPK